ncbi:hypothetical protein R0V13_04655 [Facklamia hominis]|uniref:hypothetical protein n=1 Tax=Facklamia hominis TaxID=178214 RepID=UPI0029D40E97|nr:hypothetical protein [Facklamia hominis]WPJ91648.1 hypothetical protein R0V13_04655 [Facklamia hominis]
MKKILFLGASGYFYDAALYAKSIGLYLIAIDIQPAEKAIVKTIAQTVDKPRLRFDSSGVCLYFCLKLAVK